MQKDNDFLKAAGKGHVELVQGLLDNKQVDVNATNAIGFTALFEAANNGHLAIVDLLLDRGTNINHISKIGKTALSLTVEGYNHNPNRLEVVARLLNNGATVHLNEALVWAAKTGNVELVQDLLNNKQVDVNATDALGFTALFGAAQASQEEIIKILLATGANLGTNHQNKKVLDVLPQRLKKPIALFKIRLDYNVPETVDDDLLETFWAFHGKRGETEKGQEQKDRLTIKQVLMRSVTHDIFPPEVVDLIMPLIIRDWMNEIYQNTLSPSSIQKLRTNPHFFNKPFAVKNGDGVPHNNAFSSDAEETNIVAPRY